MFTTLIQAIGQLCGRFIHILHCSTLTVPTTIAMTMSGCVSDGSWVGMANVHTLPTPTLSVLSQMMCAVRAALLKRQSKCTFTSGTEVSSNNNNNNNNNNNSNNKNNNNNYYYYLLNLPQINLQSQLAVFVTSTSSHWALPYSLSTHFRTFSLPQPEPTLLLRSKVTGLGLRAPKALTNKLVTVQNMVAEQL